MMGTRRYRTRLTLPLTLALLLSPTACTQEEKPPSLPPLTTTPTPDASNTVGLTDREQIEALYTDFILHSPEAQDVERSDRRDFFAKWLTDPALDSSIDAANKQERDHQRFGGTSTSRIFAVELKRTTATLDDCLDDSKTYLKDTRTGEIVVRGKTEPVWVTARLKRTDNGWRIYYTNTKDAPCKDR